MSSPRNDEDWMRLAIEEARKSGTPFGAILARGDEVVVRGGNVVAGGDPTGHAEMEVLRQWSRERGELDPGSLTLYTTCEPCPMCAGACVWAGLGRVVFGASIEDIARSWDQMRVPMQEIVDRGFHSIEIRNGVLREECVELFRR